MSPISKDNEALSRDSGPLLLPTALPREAGIGYGRRSLTWLVEYDELLLFGGGDHERWREIDLAHRIPGLPRYWAAEEALPANTS